MPAKMLATQFIATIQRDRKTLILSYLSKADSYHRLELTQDVKDKFTEAMQLAKIPGGATNAILTATQHSNARDKDDHYTVAFKDLAGKHIETSHIKPLAGVKAPAEIDSVSEDHFTVAYKDFAGKHIETAHVKPSAEIQSLAEIIAPAEVKTPAEVEAPAKMDPKSEHVSGTK